MQNIALKVDVSITISKCVAFRCASFDPGSNYADAIEFATIFAGENFNAISRNADTETIAVFFGDVKFPSGGHTVVSQTPTQFRVIPVEIACTDLALSKEGNTGGA